MERGEKNENVGIDFDERERVLRESFEREGGGGESGKKAFLRSQPSCIYLLASSLDAVFAAFPAHRFSFISMGIGRLAAALSPEEDWMFRFRGREREREGRETRAVERERHARVSFFSFC